MRLLGTIDDPVYHAKPRNIVERSLLHFIRDERDLPFFFLCLKIACTIIPVSVALFFTGGIVWWILVAVFVGLQIFLLGPFILMLHNTSHNAFFKSQYSWANRLIPWGFCPFMGQSPDTYFSHHIGMHHAENNMALDGSSTLLYQRDSFVDFLKYYVRFLFLGVIELVRYHRFKAKKSFLRKAAVGEIALIAACLTLAWFDWKATVVVFVVPVLVVRFFMMAGNWAQHAFIDPLAPANNYRNSITCINSAYNKQCFNDGYHIGHHLKPHLHWTEMPGDFLKNTDKYAENKALVFEGVDYNQIWAMLMMKRYGALADR
ncbi:MAG TPA: fatty acid desaturase, partial [Saprospiraceae bacterium]|nr:fatty acid desaturase [Saprospiraceae bacterium]